MPIADIILSTTVEIILYYLTNYGIHTTKLSTTVEIILYYLTSTVMTTITDLQQ